MKKNRTFSMLLVCLLIIGCSVDNSNKSGTDDTDKSSYRITFDQNGNHAAGTMNDQIASEGSTVKLIPNAFTRGGFIFTRWNTQSDGNGVEYNDGDSFTMGSENITLYAQWNWKTYNLRDVGPAGGLIFYINPTAGSNGWKYLEAAPGDQSTGTIWSNISSQIGTTGTDIGTGYTNTLAIIGQAGHTSSAAKLCADLLISNGGIDYDDWFLPSRDELNHIYNNLHKQNVGNFSNDYYNSSSEGSDTTAWEQYFMTGAQNNTFAKGLNSDRVRAIRSF